MDISQEDLFYSLKSTYNSIYRLNLRNNTATEVFSRDYVRKGIGMDKTVRSASEVARAQIKNLVRPEWQDLVSAFCDIPSMSTRLKNTDQLFIDYESVYKGWQRQSVVVFRRDPVTGEAIEVFYTTQIIDDERQEELALLQSLKNAINFEGVAAPSLNTMRAQRSAALAFASSGIERSHASFMAPDARILAVDDVEDNLKVITSLLRRTCVQVDIAGGGDEALKMTADTKYDLIIMDHMMPDPDGIATREMIAKDESNPNHDTPVVMLTANALVGVREEYLAHGFVDYIAKPVESKILEETVMRNLPPELVHERNSGKDSVNASNSDSNTISDAKAQAAPDSDHNPNFASASDRLSGKPDGNAPISRFRTSASVSGSSSFGTSSSVQSEDDAVASKLAALEKLDLDIEISNSIEKYTGTPEFYLELLTSWCNEDRIGRMSSYLKEDDMKKYRLEAHSLKGTSRALGITKVADIAEKLQLACDNESAQDVKNLHEENLSSITEIHDKISAIIL